MKHTILVFFLLVWVTTFGQSQTRRVLFLGNSYTYVNDLPQMIADLALSTGDVLIYDSHLIGGYTLEDHSTDPTSLNKILSGNWDYIVLQEQSQRPAFINPVGFMGGFMELKNYIASNKPCAQITSFMTWGHQNGDTQNCPANPAVCTYIGMQNLITERYMEFSDFFESEVTPVGAVWKYMREHYPAINLYQPDESHPSLAGSYLAACCFYTSLFRKDPTLITNNSGLDANTATNIRNVTKLLVYDEQPDWYIGRYIPHSNFNYVIGEGQNEVLINSHTPTYRDSFSWDFGDGATATTLLPTHSYAADGLYTISLTSYQCYLGELLESVFTRTVRFCAHTNTISPDLILCPGETDTLWTQPADSYQWYDDSGNPIAGATNQSLIAIAGGSYSVLTTIDGCAEMSVQIFVDMYLDNPDCSLGIVDKPNDSEVTVFPNPVGEEFYIRTNRPINTIAVNDVAGKQVHVLQISPTVFNVSGLVKGIYLLNIILENGQSVSTKIIKQ